MEPKPPSPEKKIQKTKLEEDTGINSPYENLLYLIMHAPKKPSKKEVELTREEMHRNYWTAFWVLVDSSP